MFPPSMMALCVFCAVCVYFKCFDFNYVSVYFRPILVLILNTYCLNVLIPVSHANQNTQTGIEVRSVECHVGVC